MPEILLSYSPIDGADVAAALSQRLQSVGYTVHTDSFAPYDVCIVIATPDIVRQAWSPLSRPAIVFMLGPVALPPMLALYPQISYFPNPEEAFTELREQLDWLYDPALKRLQSVIHAEIHSRPARRKRNGGLFLQHSLIAAAAVFVVVAFAFLLRSVNNDDPSSQRATQTKPLIPATATVSPTDTMMVFPTLTPTRVTWTPIPSTGIVQSSQTPIPTIPIQPTLTPSPTWTPIPIVTTVAPSLTPLPPQVNITQMDVYPQAASLRLGDTFGENVTYSATIPTRVIVDGGLVYPGTSASTGSCAGNIITLTGGPDEPWIDTTYPIQDVIFSWGPLTFGNSTDTLDANADRYVLRTRILDSNGQILACNQQVWNLEHTSAFSVTSLNIYPQGDTLRPGDSLGHDVTYTSNVPTRASNYGGWVYSGVPASNGSCLDQEVPPAPGTDFPFLMSESSFDAGTVSFPWGPATFSEGTDRAYDQTDRYVYRVRIVDATTNTTLYCYQQVWTISR